LFTGLVVDRGVIDSLERSERGARITVATPLASEIREGDSVAVNGVCLTASELIDTGFVAEVMNETLNRSSLVDLLPASEVNLELPLRPSDRLGGHLVQGHVDGVGEVAITTEDGFARLVEIVVPDELRRYIVPKGSIAVDGVSLTVVEVHQRSFTVSLIPETLERTTLGAAGPGTKVNLEVDVLAKYVERAVQAHAEGGV
jgi:riboflavin synthase